MSQKSKIQSLCAFRKAELHEALIELRVCRRRAWWNSAFRGLGFQQI